MDRREHFVSAPDEVFVSRLTAMPNPALSFTLALDRPERFTTTACGPNELLMTGTLNDGRGGAGVTYAARLRVLVRGGSVSAQGNALRVEGADEAVLLLAAATDYRGFAGRHSTIRSPPRSRPRPRRRRIVRALRRPPRRPPALVRSRGPAPARHRQQPLPTDRRLRGFASGAPDPALAALYFNFGRYLLISSSRPGGLPANLQGIWAEEIQTPWNGDWHLDINVQMNYWPAEVCGLSELHEPLHRLIASLVEPGRQNRPRLLQRPRLGRPRHHQPLGLHLARRSRLVGRDGQRLRLAVPAPLGTLRVHARPRVPAPGLSRCSRNRPSSISTTSSRSRSTAGWSPGRPTRRKTAFACPTGQIAHVCLGPTVDMQLLRELFGNVIRAAEILVDPRNLRAELLAARQRLAPNQIGPDGRLQEWLEPYGEPEPTHRHTSHLYGLHPYYEITRAAPRNWPRPAANPRGPRRRQHRLGAGWRINLWARLGDGDRAHQLLQLLLRPAGTGSGSLPNLFASCPPFQIDGISAAAPASPRCSSSLTPARSSCCPAYRMISPLPSPPMNTAARGVAGDARQGVVRGGAVISGDALSCPCSLDQPTGRVDYLNGLWFYQRAFEKLPSISS
jgi:alpha-L-fucosidase 2